VLCEEGEKFVGGDADGSEGRDEAGFGLVGGDDGDFFWVTCSSYGTLDDGVCRFLTGGVAYGYGTGVGGVLNTSFNLHGEPNVCTCQDAIHTLDNSGLNYVTLHNHLVEKIPPAGKGDRA
jgi:hypothetical protein